MKKQRKRSSIKEDTAKLLQDLGKLMFGGIFVGGIMRGDFPHYHLIIGGLAAGFVLCIIGVFLGKREKE